MRQPNLFIIKKTNLVAVFLCMFLIAAGCSNQPEDVPAEKRETGEAAGNQKQLLEKYNAVVKDAAESATIVSYLNENLLQADVNTADAMVRGLNAFYDSDLQRSQEAFFQNNVQEVLAKAEWPITAVNASSIPDEKVKQLVATKLAGGYKMVRVEGMIYPIVDYELQKTFTKKLSDDLNAYIAIQAEESKQPSAVDAGLVIDWDTLAKRALSTEAYLESYPDSPEQPVIRRLYLNSYLTMYINGLNNTPIYNNETGRLKDIVKDSYARTMNEHPDSITGRIVSSYLKVLESADWKVVAYSGGKQQLTSEVKQFQDSLIAQAEAMLPK